MPRGRPRAKIDLDMVEKLASIGCTQDEIAVVMKVTPRTMQRRTDVSDAISRGSHMLRSSLRRWQYEKAKSGNVVMLIWLGKQLLGQKDRVEETLKSEVIEIERIAPKSIE